MSISLKQIKQLPDRPGVYFFKRGKEILYIGKAASLRDRVRSYFSKQTVAESRGPRVAQLPHLATRVDYVATGSVLEALILEAALIKKYQPPYNTREKDDKSFLSVVVTKEVWPRVLVLRGNNLSQDSTLGNSKGRTFLTSATFGPFPHGNELRTAMKIIRKIFPFRDYCQPTVGKPCFNAQIGLCPGVCTGQINHRDYQKIIRQLILFLSGQRTTLIKNLAREMKQLARAEKFEEAKIARDRLFALRHIQDIALLKNVGRRASNITTANITSKIRIEAYDVAHTSGRGAVGAMVVVKDGEAIKNEYRKFKLRGAARRQSNDIANLQEILERRFNHPEWPRPNLVVVDGGRAQLNVAKKFLAARALNIPVVATVKDERHRPRAILGHRPLSNIDERAILFANSEAHRFALGYHRRLRGKIKE